MANHFYVKSGGTAVGASVDSADGVYSTRQTGTWSATASEYYDSTYEVSVGTVTPTAGDFIYVSSAHSASTNKAGDTSFSSGSANSAPITIISVDNTDREAYLPGASETTSLVRNWRFSYNIFVAGVSLGCDTDTSLIVMVGGSNEVRIQDATLTTGSGANDYLIAATTDASSLVFVNVDVSVGATGQDYLFFMGGNSKLRWYGGALTGSVPDSIIRSTGNGGAQVYVEGVDLSSATAIDNSVLETHDILGIKLQSCKMKAAYTKPTMLDADQIFEAYNCDDATADDYHTFYYSNGCGSAYNSDSVYVTATEAWYEGSAKSSMEVTTTAYCSHGQPFVFELPAQYVDLSSSASDVLTLELTTDQTLTDTDIAAFLVYPDGTTSVQANWVTSGKTVGTGNYGIDPLAAGTTLTTGALGAGDWTGEPVSPNFYKMVLDTSGDAGQATAVSIRIEVYKPSIAAGELFIHPLLTLS